MLPYVVFSVGVYNRTVPPRKDKVVIYQKPAFGGKGKECLKPHINER